MISISEGRYLELVVNVYCLPEPVLKVWNGNKYENCVRLTSFGSKTYCKLKTSRVQYKCSYTLLVRRTL